MCVTDCVESVPGLLVGGSHQGDPVTIEESRWFGGNSLLGSETVQSAAHSEAHVGAGSRGLKSGESSDLWMDRKISFDKHGRYLQGWS